MAALIRIGELAKRAGVPIATIKHYLREGLIAPARKSGRTMSWYDPALVTKLQTIKELQSRKFLPLDVIRDVLARGAAADDDLAAVDAIAGVLADHAGTRSRTRDELIERGAKPQELDWLAAAGLAVPTGEARTYAGDDLALLTTLGDARRAGLAADMLPFAILDRYLQALRGLVAAELEMFRAGVFPRASRGDVKRLTTVATRLSERLVVLLRRKLLLPTLAQLVKEETHARTKASGPRPRPQPRPRSVQRRQRSASSRRSRRDR